MPRGIKKVEPIYGTEYELWNVKDANKIDPYVNEIVANSDNEQEFVKAARSGDYDEGTYVIVEKRQVKKLVVTKDTVINTTVKVENT